MPKNMPKLGAVMMVAVIAAWVGLWVLPAVAKNAFVAVTGQTSMHAPGDDGDLQAGVPFPNPARFSDRGDGTVKDNLTNLIWLKNANCFRFTTWSQALTHANTLASGSCGLSDGSVAGDWRLPNVKELQSLIDFSFITPALSNAAGTAQWTEGDAFSDVQSFGGYWSSTTLAGFPGSAWSVFLSVGSAQAGDKGFTDRVWPVRGGTD